MIENWFAQVRAEGAGLHLSAGLPPVKVFAGEYTPLQEERLMPEDLEGVLLDLLTAEERCTLERRSQVRLALQSRSGRFRAIIFRQRDTLSGSFLPLPLSSSPWFQPGLQTLIRAMRQGKQTGLVLVAGPSGSGISTTLHALVNDWKNSQAGCLVTLEDPIEFEHQDEVSWVFQRQKGEHFFSELGALRHAVIQGTQGVLLGSLRPGKLTREAFLVASLGCRVWAGSPGMSVQAVLMRLQAEVGALEREQVLLSSGLRSVVCQRLLPSLAGGRIPVFEVLQNTGTVQSILREKNFRLLTRVMEEGAEQGMQTLEQALVQAFRAKLISRDEAYLQANEPSRLKDLLERV